MFQSELNHGNRMYGSVCSSAGERDRTPNESERREIIDWIIFEISDVGAASREEYSSRRSNRFVSPDTKEEPGSVTAYLVDIDDADGTCPPSPCQVQKS